MGKWNIPDSSLLVNQAHGILPFPAVAPEGSSETDNRTELAPKCMPEELWCPGANVCVPFDASCNSRVCINGSVSRLGLPRASYTLWKEFFFSVPAGPPTQYLVCVLVWVSDLFLATSPYLPKIVVPQLYTLQACICPIALPSCSCLHPAPEPSLISFSGPLSSALCLLRGNLYSYLEQLPAF